MKEAYHTPEGYMVGLPQTYPEEVSQMVQELQYSVPGMSCEHCRSAITKEVDTVAGVASVTVDLDAKTVVVRGEGVDDADVRAAIDEAGYDIEGAAA
jgi:copper chaperone CopZ